MNYNLEEFVGKAEQFDDVTMLVVEFREEELHLSYKEKDYKIIPDIVDNFEESFNYLKAEVKASTGIIIDELVNNLISYDEREDLEINVDFNVKKDILEIKVTCNGHDYDPFANHKEKYLEEYHSEIKEGGFGVSIIKDLTKSYSYEYKDHHSIITIDLALK